jgi:hypothetical protein
VSARARLPLASADELAPRTSPATRVLRRPKGRTEY